MEKLRFAPYRKINRRNISVVEIAIAAFGAACWCVLIKDMFGLSFDLSGENMGTFGGSLIYIWNRIAETVGNAGYVLLPKFERASGSGVLFLPVIFVAAALIQYLILKSKRVWLAAAPTVCMCLLCGAFKLSAGERDIFLLLAVLVTAIAYTARGFEGFGKNMIFAALVIAVSAGLWNLPALSDLTEKTGKMDQISRKVEELVADNFYGKNPLLSGDLTQRQRSREDGTAMEISMTMPESMYLRGFVGDIYMGDSWQALSAGSYYSRTDLMYWLRQRGFDPLGQLGQAGTLTETMEGSSSDMSGENTVEIKIIDADRRYAYLPYEVDGSSINRGKDWGGSFVTPIRGTRLSSYGYKAGQNSTAIWTDIAAGIFSMTGAGGSNTDQLDDYLEAESYYNEYVYGSFTYISDSDRALLSEYTGGAGDQSKGHIDYKEAINRIRDYLQSNFIYTEDLGEISVDADGTLEIFLREKKGYDVQFATAAVMMFRYYGIPARYVEGYLITPQDADGMETGKVAEIPLERAHAWPEIYIDGTGFVPIEVSPPYMRVMEEADMNTGISNNTLIRTFDSESQGNSGGSDLQLGGDENSHPKIRYMIFVYLFLAFILLAALIWAGKKASGRIKIIMRRHRLFAAEPPKTAVSAMFSYMDSHDLPVTDRARELGNRAAYSCSRMTEDDRSEMAGLMKEAKKEKRKNEKKSKISAGRSISGSDGHGIVGLRSKHPGKRSLRADSENSHIHP